MELEHTQEALLPAYLASFDHLIGDQRTRVTLRATVKGIIHAGSLVCQRIASASSVLAKAKEGEGSGSAAWSEGRAASGL